MTAKPKPDPKPWISGFCNPTNPRTGNYDPHDRCHGCDCSCHRGEPADLDPTPPPALALTDHAAAMMTGKITVGALEFDADGMRLTPEAMDALRDGRGASLAEVAQAIAARRLLLPLEIKAGSHEYRHGYRDALTFAINAILYGPEPTATTTTEETP